MATGTIMGLAILAGTVFLLPNELHFKISNAQGDYETAEKVFPKWKLIAQNNKLGTLYTAKKYKTLDNVLTKTVQENCRLEHKVIPAFCANFFYLDGLVNYQLGKDKDFEEQKRLFEKAILAFTKVMAMMEKGSQAYVWSQENIEFLQHKFQEKQKEASKKKDKRNDKTEKNSEAGKKDEKGSGDSKKEKREQDAQNKSNDNKASSGQKGGKEKQKQDNKKDVSGSKTAKEDKKSSGKEKGSESSKQKGVSASKSQEKSSRKGSQPAQSRLPKQMQQELEKIQQQLEADQKNSQKGFNRSQSAAKKNNIDRSDPFSDPFFQQFFGGDPFFQNPFGKKNLRKQIQNPHEKDW